MIASNCCQPGLTTNLMQIAQKVTEVTKGWERGLLFPRSLCAGSVRRSGAPRIVRRCFRETISFIANS